MKEDKINRPDRALSAEIMRNFPTLEELSQMPLLKLRSLDIRNGEEEARVQVVINSKIPTEPVKQPNIKVPDIKTKEQELYWQKKIDEAKESMRARPVSMADIVSDGNITEFKEVVEEGMDVIDETKLRFCQHCDAKGPINHKKNCNRRK